MKLSYQPHKFNKEQFRPLKDSIVVQDMVFKERMVGSIIVPGDDGKNSGIRPRWAQVYAVGPLQKVITPGQYILVAHGRWTRGIEIEDETGHHTLRKVDPKDVMMVSDVPMSDDTMGDKVL
jgi:co-chaperonin GroES (HSP10)